MTTDQELISYSKRDSHQCPLLSWFWVDRIDLRWRCCGVPDVRPGVRPVHVSAVGGTQHQRNC